MQRKIAFKIIYKTLSDNSFTNLLMRKELEKLKPINRPFVTNLVNGVLKNYDLLNFQHENLYKNCTLKNKIILSMALYERFYLNEKDYVVNNEYTNLAESEFDKNFINAILHKIKNIRYSEDEYINRSLPKWIYNLLKKQYNDERFNVILNNYLRIPKVYYRLNHKKCDYQMLDKYNIKVINDDIFTCEKNLINSYEFKNGYIYIQDINASKLVDKLELKKDDVFLDACAAPGSKLFNALEKIQTKNAYANDLNENRVELIKNRAIELGYEDIHYLNVDASTLSSVLDIKFDKILLDVPCSGLGVIGRRNDIKFHIKPESLDELQLIQENILNDVSKLLKIDGTLLYSTCTLNKKENSKQIEKFIKTHLDFSLINEATIIEEEGDLFYYALLKRV